MASNAMNQLIRQAASRRHGGALESLGDVDTEQRRAEYHEAMIAYEKAAKAGDEIGKEMADARIDRIFEEASAARDARPQEEQVQTSFDGGVRSTPGGRKPGPRRETAGDLFRRAMIESRAERAEQRDGGPQVVVVR